MPRSPGSAADGSLPVRGGEARSLGCQLHPPDDAPKELCLLFNTGDAALDFAVPPPRQPRPWRPLFDTARAVADEGRPVENAPSPANGARDPMAARRLVLLAV